MKSSSLHRRKNHVEDVKTIMDGLRAVMKVLRDSSQTVEDQFGVTSAQLYVLQTLAKHPFSSINELAKRTFTHQSSVSVVVAKLVTKGYARRAPSEQDRRRVVLNVTAKGKALLQRAPMPAQNHLVEGIDKLAAIDRRALRNGLTALVGAFKPKKTAPPMFFES